MAVRSFTSLVSVLLLVLIATSLPSASVRAQDTSRTFPETGKTMGGIFLQYWDRHGGLAQQGFPISEVLQETSDVDGRIYTVQYMERAVFEHHPENQPPYNVLLSLLGVFRYHQKYPQGASGQVPNTEPNSHLFPETGKRLGGLFRTYWESHGGLTQQGYPISDEFVEVSDLNGQTYKVQYFERAVFEYHPENQPPYNVLLSQLGTYRYREKYGGLSAQLNGSTNQIVPFALRPGLAQFQSVRSANGGYFYIDVDDATGNHLATIATGSIPVDLSYVIPVPAEGMYALDAQSEGGWTVNVSQPKATYAAPPAFQRWSGTYTQATPLFSLKAGQAVFHAVSPNSPELWRVTLLNQDGRWVGDIVNAPGSADKTVSINIPADSVYVIQVLSDGDWVIEVQQ